MPNVDSNNTVRDNRAWRVLWVAIALTLGVTPCVPAATQTISGYVQHEDFRRIPYAAVTMRDQEGRRVTSTTTGEAGEFEMVAPHAGTFSVNAMQDTYRSATVVLTIGTDAPAPVVLTMTDSPELALEIVAPLPPTKPRVSSEMLSISRKTIDALPKGDNVDIADVLITIPSAVNGGLRQTHIRQEHANLQYRIDGVPIPDTITTQFTDLIHPRTWERADIILGGMEAQYGNRTTAVIDITSKSGTRPASGSFQAFGGDHGTVQQSFEYGGTVGDRFRWYLMNNYLTTNRGIEPPTLGRGSYHNHSERNQTYLRGDYQLNNRQNLTWLVLNSVADYQIPTQPGQEPNDHVMGLLTYDPDFTLKASELIDENQEEQNQYSHLVWRYDINADRFVSVAGYFRHSLASFSTDPYQALAYTEDDGEPFSAGHQERQGVAGGVRVDYTHAFKDRHLVKAGFQLDRTTAKNTTELFLFNREPGTGDHREPIGEVMRRNGNRRLTGYREEFWVQDQFTPHEQWTINIGLRLDHVHGYLDIDTVHVSPRVGVAFAPNANHAFHAYYGRLFTPPSLESVPFVALNTEDTTAHPEDDTNIAPQPERSHSFQVGSTHAIGDTVTFQLTGYYKLNTNMSDAHQYGSTPMLSYFAYKRGWQRGIDGAVRATLADGLTARGTVAWGQCKGKGLQSGHFLLHEEELRDIESSDGIYCDHMQEVTSSALVTYRVLPQTTISGQMLFGSGLRSHAEGDGINTTNASHADSHTTYNVSLTHVIPLARQHKLVLGVDAINLFDQHEFLNVGERSVGLGVSHTNQPRSIFFRGQWVF